MCFKILIIVTIYTVIKNDIKIKIVSKVKRI